MIFFLVIRIPIIQNLFLSDKVIEKLRNIFLGIMKYELVYYLHWASTENAWCWDTGWFHKMELQTWISIEGVYFSYNGFQIVIWYNLYQINIILLAQNINLKTSLSLALVQRFQVTVLAFLESLLVRFTEPWHRPFLQVSSKCKLYLSVP